MLLMIPFSLLTFFFCTFYFVCWCSVSYCTGRYACTVHHCSLWECLWSKVGQKAWWFILPTNPLSLRWASRGEGWCRQVKLFLFLHTYLPSECSQPAEHEQLWQSVHSRYHFLGFLLFHYSVLLVSISATVVQTNMYILFNCDVTNEVVFFAEILLDDFMLTHPIFLAPDKFQQVLLQQYPFSSPEP